jgi:flavin reductase (DIM6/NTAB) family NADH-FMN oxidoreductase RutF
MTPLLFDEADLESRRRRLLWAMPTGIYLVGSAGDDGGPYNLMTHSLAVQVSTEPCVVALSIERSARTHAYISATSRCSLSVLRRDQRAIVRRFVKPVELVGYDAQGGLQALGGEPAALTPTGSPYLTDAAGCLDLRVIERVDFTSHSLFCCVVVAVATGEAVLEGPASARSFEVLRMEDTKMNYGG